MRWLVVVLVSGCGAVSTPDAGVDGSGTNQALVAKCMGCHEQQLGPQWSSVSTHSLLFDCSTCHVAMKDSGAGHASSKECGECHGAKNHRSLACRDCHDVHGSSNLFLLRARVTGETVSVTTPVLVKGDGTGVCEVCHTNTAHYRRDGSGTAHDTQWCIGCHSHDTGFLPDAG
jgi:predicted CXXCH cytochrome family protein